MIKSLKMQNFQSHKDTVIEFSQGVNALVGKSDSGKSAIFRALNWVINNKPTGDAYRSHWGGDTSVELLLTDGTKIIRKRTDKENLYILDGQELKAFGQGEPPKEIREALNITDINMQTQMDGPFLVGASGGEVARYLNKIVSLDSIDSTLSNINKELMVAKRDLTSAETDVERFKEEVTQYDYLPQMEVDCSALEALEKAVEQNTVMAGGLNKTLTMIQEHNSTLLGTSTFIDGLGPILAETERMYGDAAAASGRAAMLKAVLSEISRLKTVLNNIPTYRGAPEAIKALQGILADLDATRGSVFLLDRLLDDIDTKDAACNIIEDKIKKAQLEFNALMPNVCPLCNQEVTSCEPSKHQKTKRSRN